NVQHLRKTFFMRPGSDPRATQIELRLHTFPLSRASVANNVPVVASHKRAGSVSHAVTMRVPSGLNSATCTTPVDPASVASALPVAISHTRMVLSSDAVATRLPSGLIFTNP